MKALTRTLRELMKYPSAIAGLSVILFLLGMSVYTIISIPYSEAIRLWRGGEDVWYQNPRQAPPAWINLFTKKDLPASFKLGEGNDQVVTTYQTNEQGMTTASTTFAFEYLYDEFPQEVLLYFNARNVEKQPFISVVWVTPDERQINVTSLVIQAAKTYRFSQDDKLMRILRQEPLIALFAVPGSDPPLPLKGAYQVLVTASTFEAEAKVDVEFVLHGLLYGMAGTDHQRRDLSIALLWGAPVALAFGLLAALGTTITTMSIAALGVWYGNWVDELIQRVTEVNLVLPFLPIMIMIGTFYSRSIWLILGATILLNIFGGSIKTYRAMFMQVKESPYIEAAQSYGASDARIIFKYLTPRLIPTLIPQLVTLIPTYVFLEASLAVLGLGDPVLPTWGKVINDARANGALYEGLYYWVLEPAALLMIAGLAFAMLGYSLDRVFNPRLRGM